MGAAKALGVLTLASMVPLAGCNSDGTFGTCVVPPPDRAPQRGECTLVDWDALSVDGDAVRLAYYVNPGCTSDLDRVEIDENEFAVRLKVVVGANGDEGATCGTGVAPATTSVSLRSPLGARKLLGCRPVGSFVPEGGYNDPAPRDPEFDCRPKG